MFSVQFFLVPPWGHPGRPPPLVKPVISGGARGVDFLIFGLDLARRFLAKIEGGLTGIGVRDPGGVPGDPDG